MTWDMHLVEYELIVTHNESDEKVSQDSPIKLRCSPLGQWHLHADSTPRMPPLSITHPLVSLFLPLSPLSTSSSASTAATTATGLEDIFESRSGMQCLVRTSQLAVFFLTTCSPSFPMV
ncbi:unnamed protein product [Hydatigera taeniaeformis]|uniref:Uncharacterized protein n=1 Tax=Hydatigena taeniaeformis TaxID=6205 RepID=A0A3P7GTK3_HYDTA|nr:unnamed protein product [Hydatigera taeniaeformis]